MAEKKRHKVLQLILSVLDVPALTRNTTKNNEKKEKKKINNILTNINKEKLPFTVNRWHIQMLKDIFWGLYKKILLYNEMHPLLHVILQCRW